MPENCFFSKSEILAVLPDDSEIGQNAHLTYPKNPLYKDVNSNFREGYIRGQIDMVNRIRSLVNCVNSTSRVTRKIDINNLSKRGKIDIESVMADKGLSVRAKIDLFENELLYEQDEEVYMRIARQIDLLEDKLMVSEKL